MSAQHIELAGLFRSVTQALAQNQQTLNRADEVNRNHGDNMVQTFQTITRALQEKQGQPDSAALAYAAQKLGRSAASSSGQLYAQGLARAATQFQGQQVDERGALELLQTLIGGGQAPQQPQGGQSAEGGDLLGSLLGGLAGGQPQPQSGGQPAEGGDLLGSLLGGLAGDQSQPQSGGQPAEGGDLLGSLLGGLAGDQSQPQSGGQPAEGGDLLGSLLGGLAGDQSQPQSGEQPAEGGDLLGSLLGGLAGDQSQPQSDGQPAGGGDLLDTLIGGLTGSNQNTAGLSDGLDMKDLITAGLSFLRAKQSGGSNAQALVQAFLAVSGMGKAAHRQQSTQVVVNSFLQALQGASQ
jgi:hypothetical protein